MFRALLTTLLLLCMTAPSFAAYETGGVVKTIMSNGVTVLMRKEPEARTAAIEVFLRVGAEDESPQNAGIGHILAGSILAGTETRSALKLARLISEVGGNFHAVWQPNYLEIHAVTIPEMADETISLLADSVMNSSLDPRAIEYSKNAILKECERQADDAFSIAHGALRRTVQKGSAYDRPYLGDPERIKAVTRDDLKAFYERNISADRVVISVTGNIDLPKVSRKIEVCFGSMPRRVTQRPAPSAASPVGGESRIEKSGPSSYIMIGYQCPGIESPDYAPMCVANVLLGGNKSSLLFRNVREKLGLGYQIGSLYPDQRGLSYTAAYLGLDSSRATPDTLDAARNAIVDQVAVLCSGGFSDDDLERAKRYLIGSHALNHERTRDRAQFLGRYEAIGLGYQNDFLYGARIKQVTREHVQDVCARYLKNPSVVIVAPQQAQQ